MTATITQTPLRSVLCKSMTAYRPHEEWLLTSAFLLETNIPGDIELKDCYGLLRSRRNETVIIADILNDYDDSIYHMMIGEYGCDRKVAKAIEDRCLYLFKQMIGYHTKLIEGIDQYYNFGFFDTFTDDMEQGIKQFCKLAWNVKDKRSHSFARALLMDRCYYLSYPLPDVPLSLRHAVWQKEQWRREVLLYIISYFQVEAKVWWSPNTNPTIVKSDCEHKSMVSAGDHLTCVEDDCTYTKEIDPMLWGYC